MAVETADDRLIFLDVDDFGSTASYTVQGGSAVDIKGIFDNEHIEVDATGTVGVSVQQPRFMCRKKKSTLSTPQSMNRNESVVAPSHRPRRRIVTRERAVTKRRTGRHV